MDLHLDDSALWKKRMRAPMIKRFIIARHDPSVGQVVSNQDGKLKTYLWNPVTGVVDGNPCLDEDYYGVFSPDGKHLHYMKDTKGNQHGHRWRMNVKTGEHEDLTPNLPDYFAYRTAFSDDSRFFAFLANHSNKTFIYSITFDYEGKLADRKTLVETTESLMLLRISPDGKLIAFSTTENGKTDSSVINVIDRTTGNLITRYSAGEKTFCYPLLFLPNSSRLIMSIERDKDLKTYIWDYATGKLEDLVFGNDGINFVRELSTDGSKLLVDNESMGKQHTFIHDLKAGTTIELETIPGMSHPMQFTGDNVYILNQCSKYKSRVLVYDGKTGAFTRIALELPGSIESKEAEEVCFTGALGDKVYGWLRKPEGKGPFPTIIEVPGGPFVYAYNSYEPDVYLEHGITRLYLSYHGCGTFGEEFRKSIIGRIGELELEDMVAARNWLVEQGIAIPDQIFLMGGSYGGYLTLWGTVKRPDLWRGGLARVPIADWKSAWEDVNGELQKMDTMLFGCTPSENPELWAKSSPITFVENLKAPLQIITGLHDTRCPRRQNEDFIAKAKALGKDIEEYWFDEGHGSSVVDEQIKQIELRLNFIKRVLEK
jgi:dipeptidyl aminopeptidase/acylaminoacyl peptidase